MMEVLPFRRIRKLLKIPIRKSALVAELVNESIISDLVPNTCLD